MRLLKKLILISATLFALTPSWSQTITLGTGTATNAYNEPSPVNITRDRSVSWTVYTAAELNAAGITGPADINRMGYFVTNIPVNTIPGYTISMKHTTAQNAGQNPGNNGYTEVKSAFTYSPIQGDWDMIDLDVPFTWNGVNNIAVKVCWSTANNDPSGQLRVYPATNGYRYRWTNNGNGSYCGANPNNNRQWKPQVRFVFETETVWTGAVSTDWFNPANWSAGLPSQDMDTRIPTGTPNNPVLNGNASVGNFTMQGTMTIDPAGTLNVYGNFINTGNYIDNGGTTSMTGTGPNNISNSASLNISNLIIDSKFGATVTGSQITVTEELQVNKSALNTNDSIILRSDATGTARIAELTTNCFYQLDMFDAWGDGWNGGLLTVYEDGVPVFTFQAFGSATTETVPIENGSVMTLEYSSGIFENENSYTLYDPSGAPIFNDGPNPTTGVVFTTTAACGFTQDPIQGEISMERYIDAGETYWRYFGSAVQGANLAQFNDDFTTAGYPGSLFPTFPWISAFNYDETAGPGAGYNATTGATQVMQTGEGWQIWCGDTIIGTQPFTFDLRGVPHQGDINLPVTYTNTGTPNEDGFNLVCNPYPSTIDWDDPDWTKTNMANAVYIQNPDNQQYATYIAGASTNGGSRYVASQQAFWVQSFAAGPVLGATEGVKSSVDQAFIKAASVASPGMTITLQGDAKFDEIVIRDVEEADDDFNYEWDANKFWGGWGEYPQFSAINGQQKDLTVHSFNKGNQEWQIPLRAIVFADGVYNVEFENVGEMGVPCMKLEDTYTGTMYDVYEGAAYSFYMDDSTYSPRFVLHIGRDYESVTTDLSCPDVVDGQIQLDLDLPGNTVYHLTSNTGTIVDSASADPLVITGLDWGIYSIDVPALSNLCNVKQFNFVIDKPSAIASNPVVTDEIYGNDGYINPQITGGTPPYQFDWDNGWNTPMLKELPAGTYMVTVTDDNGCEFSETYTVNSVLSIENEDVSIKVFYNSMTNSIQVEGLSSLSCDQLTLFNLNGQKMQDFVVEGSDVQNFYLDEVPAGFYLFFGECGIMHKFVISK